MARVKEFYTEMQEIWQEQREEHERSGDNDFEYFCYLIVCRQKANTERHRLRRVLDKKLESVKIGRYGANVHQMYGDSVKELMAYREYAEYMKSIAKALYSPLKRKLNCKIKYDANNNVVMVNFDGQNIAYDRIVEFATGYQFEELVLRDRANVQNPYLRG